MGLLNAIVGRAACKECGTIVVAEVEEDVVCSGCNRVFQIPNAPQYTQAFLHSIRSTSVARLGIGFGINKLLNAVPSEEDAETTCWEIPKAERQRKIKAPKVLLFPERGEPYVSQEENWLWVIAEYSGHSSLDQIQRIVKNQTLFLKSVLPLCSYKDIVEGLGVFTKIFEENLRNGILEVKLKE